MLQIGKKPTINVRLTQFIFVLQKPIKLWVTTIEIHHNPKPIKLWVTTIEIHPNPTTKANQIVGHNY